MSRAVLFFTLLLAAMLSRAAEQHAPPDADRIRIYEVAVRHFIEARPVPHTATLWVAVNARPAPQELLDRFAGEAPTVRASPCDPKVRHEYVCGILDGTIVSHEAYISVHGTPDHGAHFYHFKKQGRDWLLLEDAAGYVDQ